MITDLRFIKHKKRPLMYLLKHTNGTQKICHRELAEEYYGDRLEVVIESEWRWEPLSDATYNLYKTAREIGL